MFKRWSQAGFALCFTHQLNVKVVPKWHCFDGIKYGERWPDDEKIVAHLAGELSNAATYPSTYCQVEKSDLIDENALTQDDYSLWQPCPTSNTKPVSQDGSSSVTNPADPVSKDGSSSTTKPVHSDVGTALLNLFIQCHQVVAPVPLNLHHTLQCCLHMLILKKQRADFRPWSRTSCLYSPYLRSLMPSGNTKQGTSFGSTRLAAMSYK